MSKVTPIVRIAVAMFSFSSLCYEISLAQWPDRFQSFPFAQNSGDDRHPDFSSAADEYGWVGDLLYLTYDSEVDSGNPEVFLRARHRQDEFWGEPVRLTFDPSLDQFPVVEVLNEKPLVVWETNRRGHFDLMFTILDSSGWSEPAFITEDLADDRRPELFSTQIWRYSLPDTFWTVLVWERAGQLYWSQHSNSAWQSPEPVAPDSAVQTNPALYFMGDRIWLTWQSDQCGNWDIFGSWLNPGSNQWALRQQLTRNELEDRYPTLLLGGWWDGTNVRLVWQSNRDGNEEIYARGWWKEEDSTYLSEPVNLTCNDSADVEPYALFIPYG